MLAMNTLSPYGHGKLQTLLPKIKLKIVKGNENFGKFLPISVNLPGAQYLKGFLLFTVTERTLLGD